MCCVVCEQNTEQNCLGDAGKFTANKSDTWLDDVVIS